VSVKNRNWNSWRCRTWLALIAVGPAAVWFSSARAQTTDSSATSATTTAPYALFQDSTITSSGNTINASCVPTVVGTKVYYWNVAVQFEVSATGTLSLAGAPTVIQCPLVNSGNFKAGQYMAPPAVISDAIINVSGPAVGPGGTTKWSLAAAPGANGCTYPPTATWYVGPIASSPYLTRIQAAKVPPDIQSAWYFGIGGENGCGSDWDNNSLLGLSQIGNTITIVSFTPNDGGAYQPPRDQPEPVDTITYSLCSGTCP
jgi:hypothetical protein